uniref:Regulatory protein zeste n=2 Tax=Caenorhabditis japonica TaxID=281687 RepID=A0A8R1HJB7_CAEJA
MEQIMAMVKTVNNASSPVPLAIAPQPKSSFEMTPSEFRTEIKQEESMFAQVFPHLSTSSESTSEDHVSFDYPESETNDSRTQLPFRQYAGDPREKKLQEKIEFVKIVHKHKSALFGDCDGHEITPRSKEDAWKRVAAEVESAKLESYRGKPWARLRDHDWQYVRRHALSRNENTTRPCGKLGELDRIVLEIITTTALANAVNQATNSFVSQGSTNSHISQQSTDSVDIWKTLLSSVKQESAETQEIGTSFESSREEMLTTAKHEDISVNTCLPVPVTAPIASTAENILDYLHKVTHVSPTLSVDAAIQSASRAFTRSPNAKKICSRSATAPSVYAITSSTASPPAVHTSTQSPLIKRPRIEADKSPGSSSSSVTSSLEQKKEALMLRKIEVEIRHTELLNEKLELEIRVLENQEKRSNELHAIELRAAKARMLRGAAIDEPSVDTNNQQRVLVRQPNGYNLE